MIRAIFLALLFAAPVSAEIIYCPKNGRPYDTSHGYYVDVPGTSQYVAPSSRPSRSKPTYTRKVKSTTTYPVTYSRPRVITPRVVKPTKIRNRTVAPVTTRSRRSVSYPVYSYPGDEGLINGLHPDLSIGLY